jgi:protein-S-isoprenylcysteine O-methyltransferase Ste14
MAIATTQMPAAVDAVLRLPLRRRVQQPVYWKWIRFLVFGRAMPAVLFAGMGWLQLGHLRQALGGGLLVVLPRGLYLVFCCIPVALYLTRAMPVSRDGRVVARAAAFGGTCMQLVIGVVVQPHHLLFRPTEAVVALAGLLSIAAFSFACVSLAYLRRNLSIIPEARRLVTGGPYRIARHPLYLAEITAAFSLLLAGPYVTSAVAFTGFLALQFARARMEERLLADTFPEYTDYARRTRRLIPFAW